MLRHKLDIKSIYTITPETCISSEEIIKGVEEEDYYRESYNRFGVLNRYISKPNESFENLASEAINCLFNDENIKPDEIRCLVVVSQTTSSRLPNAGHMIQKLTGLSDDCMIFDVNDGCNGYINGMALISKFLDQGDIGLLVCGDLMSRFTTKDELSNKLLMGDAISITSVEQLSTNNGCLKIHNDGSNCDSIRLEKSGNKYLFKMDGFKVFSFTMSKIPKLIKSFTNDSNEKFDVYVLHQANKILLENIRKKLSIEEGMMPLSLENYGNTGPASIPVTLSSTKIKKNAKALLVGFGAGLSWGAISINKLNFNAKIISKKI